MARSIRKAAVKNEIVNVPAVEVENSVSPTVNDTPIRDIDWSAIKRSDDMKAVPASDCAITGRTAAFFSVLPESFTVPKEAQKTGKYVHQLAFTNRTEGCNPAMPDISLLLASGNLYPADAQDVKQVPVSSPKYDHYKDVVFVAHEIVKRMAASDTPVSAHSLYHNTDVVAVASLLKGAVITKKDNSNGNHIYYGIADTLRDLENVGAVYAIDAKGGIRRATTAYAMNDAFRSLVTLDVVE